MTTRSPLVSLPVFTELTALAASGHSAPCVRAGFS